MAGYGENALIRGLSFLSEKQASIANNLANVDTTSFKRRAAIAEDTGPRFQSMLDHRMSGIDYTEQSDMQRGTLRETGNRLDVAIDGPQWLRVRDDAGREFYTRNGQFQISPQGNLTNREGMDVLSRDGNPIALGAGANAPTDLTFSPNGSIVDQSSGRTFGPIAMTTLADPHSLVPIGRGLYTDPKNQAGEQAIDGLQQGFLEGSNVDSLQELVAMITVERSFAATQKALTGVNRLQENLITNMLR